MAVFRQTVPDVYRRTGCIQRVFELNSQSILEHAGEHLVIFDWPSVSLGDPPNYQSFLRSVQIQTVADESEFQTQQARAMPPGMAGVRHATQPTSDIIFSDNEVELRRELASLPIRSMAGSEQEWNAYKKDFRFVYGKIAKNQLLQVKLTIDTDSPGFLQWTFPNPSRRIEFSGFDNRDTFEIVIQARIYSIAQVAIHGEQRGQIRINLEPCGELNKYSGFVAIDFGNNSSTIACIPSDKFSAEDVMLVNADPKVLNPGSQPSLESKLRITTYQSAATAADPSNSRGAFSQVTCYTGTDAIRTHAAQGFLVEGLKPLLADPSEEPPLRIELDSGQQFMPKSEPGEIFLTEMFRAFHREQLARAIPVTLTYPTTYSLGEITRLKSAVTRAFHRAMLMSGLDPGKLWDEMPKIIGEQIDEATAAAFYYLYRDFIDGPGQTAAFKYLYPQGLNLLLYDCGGGTTDIALVNAYPTHIKREGIDGKVRETWQVKLSLLGRTGHRRFGGDNITAAMATAIKWLIAHEIAQNDIPAPRVGLTSKELTRLKLALNKLLPTAWKCPETGQELHTEPNKIRKCMAAARDLIRYAEEVKIKLSESHGNEDAKPQFPDLPGYSQLYGLIRNACKLYQGEEQKVSTSVKNKLPSLLAIVNDLIYEDVNLTVTASNNLIRDRLVKPTSTADCPIDIESNKSDQSEALTSTLLAADSCIHWVYVVGKASQFPLILERLRESLDVEDLDPVKAEDRRQCRLVLEKELLKGAVARGAVLARMFCKTVQDVEIVYDRKMPLKLAFEMGIRLAGRGIQRMFEPDQFYNHLVPFEFDAAEREPEDSDGMGPADRGQTLTIYRRWPGMAGSGTNNGWEDYLLFEFPENVQGTITIGYEPIAEGSSECAFIATSQNPYHRALGVETAREMFQSPLTRGQL